MLPLRRRKRRGLCGRSLLRTFWCVALVAISRVARVAASGTINIQFTSFFAESSSSSSASSTLRPVTSSGNDKFGLSRSATSGLLIGAFDPQSVQSLSAKYELTASDQVAFPTPEWQVLKSNQEDSQNSGFSGAPPNPQIHYARLNSNQTNGSASLCVFISNSLAPASNSATNATTLEDAQEVDYIVSTMQQLCQPSDVVAVLYPYHKLQEAMMDLFSNKSSHLNSTVSPLTEVSKLLTNGGQYLVSEYRDYVLLSLPKDACLASALTAASGTMQTSVCRGRDCVCAGGRGDVQDTESGSSSQDSTVVGGGDSHGTNNNNNNNNSAKAKSDEATQKAILGVLMANGLGFFVLVMGYVIWKRRQNGVDEDDLPPGYVMTELETDTDYQAENILSFESQPGDESDPCGDCGHDHHTASGTMGTNGTDDSSYHLCVNSPAATCHQTKHPARNHRDSHSRLARFVQDSDVQAISMSFDQLEQQQPIGKGGYGVVYKAVLLDSRTVVALKRIRLDKPSSSTPPQAETASDAVLPATSVRIHSLMREVKLLMRLRHPNIVALVGVAVDASSSCRGREVGVVYELMARGDLRQFLVEFARRAHPKGFDQVKIRIAGEIANALQFVHAQRVVHRDLKSRNILLNDALEAKLSDFGLALELPQQDLPEVVVQDPEDTHKRPQRGKKRPHRTRAMAGSHLWMAPEVLKGEAYDAKADIFAFGVVLSELDTHELPYTQALRSGQFSFFGRSVRVSEQHVLDQVASGKLQVQFTKSASQDPVVALAQSCVSVDPGQRPSASELWSKLQENLEKPQQV